MPPFPSPYPYHLPLTLTLTKVLTLFGGDSRWLGLGDELERDPAVVTFSCDECARCFVTSTSLKSHERCVHKRRSLQRLYSAENGICVVCKTKFSTRHRLIAHLIDKRKPGKGGEIHITDAIQSLIESNDRFIGHKFTGKYLDCGSMNGYIKSSVEINKL